MVEVEPSPNVHAHSSPEEDKLENVTDSPAFGVSGEYVNFTSTFLQAIAAKQSVNKIQIFLIIIIGIQPVYLFVAPKPSHLPLGIMARVLLYQFDGSR